jgi:hypothetical protein
LATTGGALSALEASSDMADLSNLIFTLLSTSTKMYRSVIVAILPWIPAEVTTLSPFLVPQRISFDLFAF